MKRNGSKSDRYTIAQIKKAIEGSGGIVSTVARKLGCNWNTARKKIEGTEETQQAYKDEVERMVDAAETVIYTSITEEKNTQDAKWFLSKKGKHRGYGDQVEVSGNIGISFGEFEDV